MQPFFLRFFSSFLSEDRVKAYKYRLPESPVGDAAAGTSGTAGFSVPAHIKILMQTLSAPAVLE